MKAKKLSLVAAGALFLSPAFLFPGKAGAGVHVNVGINLAPPPLVIAAPPAVVPIPGTYAYYAPDVQAEILFYGGYWYRPYEGRWFRARSYNGPWGVVVTERVPTVLLHLPPDYRHGRAMYGPIPYGQLKKNWKTWERERHWDRHAERHDHGERHGEGRGNHGRD